MSKKKFKKILIANRGEIALRCVRACKELGIKSVVVYSEADKNSLPVQLADDSIYIGPSESEKSYLNINRIIQAAKETNSEAIFPGYGYLSENADFAKACASNDIIFIGPPSDVIANMGNKSKAREIMANAGVPLIPGSDGIVKSVRKAAALAQSFGYPVIVKASAGGGGKGMRIAYNKDDLHSAFDMAKAEAKSSFGDDYMYLEKYIGGVRHIEIQILADTLGNVIHLGERECSIQRRYQKLIEETPSPGIDINLRHIMGEIAVKAAKKIGYVGAGTVEFILDGDKTFYFVEMNTRIQVEHPITEMVTGVDLVRGQIMIAAGVPLSYEQGDISFRGHSIECRINAEDPDNNFMPCPGKITSYFPPAGPGVRVDSHLYSGYFVPHYYDSLISKLIVYDQDRNSCIARMKRALEEYVITGIHTTIPFHLKVLADPDFQKGNYSTDFVKNMLSPKEKPAPEKTSQQPFDLLIRKQLHPPPVGTHGCFDDYCDY